MPTGVYKRTKEYREIMQKTAIKNGFGKWMVGRPSLCKGKKYPQRSRENSPTWKGGTHINEGYRYIFKPEHPYAKKSGYIAEHRIVLENFLKRYLTKKEMPHHVNHIRNDNRLVNLMLFTDRSNHVKFESGKKISKLNIIFDGRKLKKEKNYDRL